MAIPFGSIILSSGITPFFNRREQRSRPRSLDKRALPSHLFPMLSGNPDPSSDLLLIIETKRNSSVDACDIVSEASGWIKAQLKGAGVPFQYGACSKDDHSSFSSFTIVRDSDRARIVFELKIAEIDREPFAFVDVHELGKPTERLFPFFGEIGSDKGRERILHYIADFILGTEVTAEPG